MYHTENNPVAGNLKISQDVIASIASFAIKEIDGVASLAPFTANVKDWLIKKQTARPIVISLNDDVATIDLHLNLKFGYKIPDVAFRVQQSVKDAVQSMTGIAVAKVNVYIAGIVFEEPKANQ